ncbi:hypothetical protein AB670_03666 [Chryseobacterium sp. MOF25P]|jgi:hypothetical protein|uniref:Uncharacterized protein n=1 Tax=Chryseobacterium balustinum TaxID=246 RepID=A0AAX2IL58_9FLAO|nr:hypothetical protein AB670_03666 [Chryseobacterium sp. MOF25P]OBW47357.1 hypothetical protein AB671_00569 [Chryseobacterium sp. BGARF1]SKB54243.1 hypothetical protein SAMN05421800_10360 [Chryseobacterium balustinum]SQA89854.1 Uncharacterised protein [Chryseobacterium balustinum]
MEISDYLSLLENFILLGLVLLFVFFISICLKQQSSKSGFWYYSQDFPHYKKYFSKK